MERVDTGQGSGRSEPIGERVRRTLGGAATGSAGKRKKRKKKKAKEGLQLNRYGPSLTAKQVEHGFHRTRAGGRWEEMGTFQLDYLKQQGLAPESFLLDVGCGPLRAGRHFARYLEPAHYFGIDVNESLVRAGWERELDEETRRRLPEENLRITDRFECDFGATFDFALAQSVFTHLPLNHIRLCLFQVAKVMAPGGRFFCTFFEVADDVPYDRPFTQPGKKGSPTRSTRDPYHYYRYEMEWASTIAPWDFRYIGDWNHPRGQRMLELRRR